METKVPCTVIVLAHDIVVLQEVTAVMQLRVASKSTELIGAKFLAPTLTSITYKLIYYHYEKP